MTIEQDTLRADFRALMSAPLLGSDYSTDLSAVPRIGKLLTGASGREVGRDKFAQNKNASFLNDDNYWRSRFDVH